MEQDSHSTAAYQATLLSVSAIPLLLFCLFELNSNISALLFSQFTLSAKISRKIYHELMAISLFILFDIFAQFHYDLFHSLMIGIIGTIAPLTHNLILLSSNHFKHFQNESTLVYIAHFMFKNNTNKLFNINNIYSENLLNSRIDSRLRKPGDYKSFITSVIRPWNYIMIVCFVGVTIIAYLGRVYCKKLSIIFSVALFGNGFGMLVPTFLRYLTDDKWIFHRIVDYIGVKSVLDCSSNKKTVEGSLGVFLASLVLVLVVVDSSEYSGVMCLIIAMGYTCVEAFAPKDFDNPLLFLYAMVVFTVF